MNDDLHDPSKRVKPNYGKAQWVEAKRTGIDPTIASRTHTFGVSSLMPGTIIFVHGVNSEGEWYRDAAEQFAEGLKIRLGREDLQKLEPDPTEKYRFRRIQENGKRTLSPIIPFYWGYSVPEDQRRLLDHREKVWTDVYGNPLRGDGTWGGGPFQNGTSSLAQFWSETGFRKDIMQGLIDLNAINPIVGRTLHDCPDRLYYVHAARRLAHLVCTIREDFAGEPINIVSHSQGTMIALCALFFIKQAGVRGPDTVMLNSSPYRFDNKFTDYLAAAEGLAGVPSEQARKRTFASAAEIVQRAAWDFKNEPLPRAKCAHEPEPRHCYDARMYVSVPDDNPDWQIDIGAGDVTREGKKWWQVGTHARDNRGKLYVNFNPADRVIGVAAVEGMGWRGVPPIYLGEGKSELGANVLQRIFARGSHEEHNPPVGARTQYKQPYYHVQIERKSVRTDSGGELVSSDGQAVQTVDESWRYLDGSLANQGWKIASEKMLGLVPALGSLSPYGPGGQSEYVYINAPLVPRPAELGQDFDGAAIRYDGQPQTAEGDQPAIKADLEQQEDYREDVHFQKRRLVTEQSSRGVWLKRYETDLEVESRMAQSVGHKVVSPTNHAAILRYTLDLNSGPVRQVLAYDLTVGRGYAFGDEDYWNYLLDLADWKKSDPYYKSGQLTVEKPGLANAPEGIDTRMLKPEVAAALAGVRA